MTGKFTEPLNIGHHNQDKAKTPRALPFFFPSLFIRIPTLAILTTMEMGRETDIEPASTGILELSFYF